MAGVLKITIRESADTLYQKLQKASHTIQRSKLQILWWLKTEKVKSVAQISEWSGYHRTTVSRWLSSYRQQGLEAMLEIKDKSGRPSVMPEAVKERLRAELKKEEGFSSYKQIQEWLASECDLALEYKTVFKIVRYDLKAKLKRPRPVSVKQASAVIEKYKKTHSARQKSGKGCVEEIERV